MPNMPKLNLNELESRITPTTLTVNSIGDNITAGDSLVTLREAIIAANGDTAIDTGAVGSGKDTIDFAPTLSGQKIILQGTALPSITKDVTITGPGAKNLSIDGNDLSSVLQVDAGATVEITGLTVTGASKTGATMFAEPFGINNSGRLSLDAVAIIDNFGFGIINSNKLTITNSTISGNVPPSDQSLSGGGHSQSNEFRV